MEKSGWARKDQLSASKEEVAATSTPTFRKPPSPIFSQKKLEGEIVFEASVTKDGDVTSVRTLSNTTGDSGIESQNRVQLSNSKFYPLLVNGRPQPFVYEYSVAY